MIRTLHKLLVSNRQSTFLSGYNSGEAITRLFGTSQIHLEKKEDCPEICIQCPRTKKIRKKPPPCPPKPCPKIRYACPLPDPPDHCPYKPPPCPPKCSKKPKKKRLPPADCCK